MSKDFFDFNDLSDLPEELQGKLTSDTDASERAWAGIVLAGAAAGHDSLSINQIIAVATRMKLEIPTQTTVRNWLNKAVERKLIGKPSRMSYGPVGAVSAAPEAEAAAEAVEAAAVEADPLAGLV